MAASQSSTVHRKETALNNTRQNNDVYAIDAAVLLAQHSTTFGCFDCKHEPPLHAHGPDNTYGSQRICTQTSTRAQHLPEPMYVRT